ncbi:hypothetical protein pVco7_gp004 [Vibrio phage pVco-7]|uniref:Uncharacterized protein n=1 Tax=Vibrio phage pVco-5 TaxID=1965485 RepID=A0A1W6JUM9_9CAUD|nr:hypothetical protein KNT61_gp005 [Vibrio phage pVco-5]ARM70993.1 hypothetical protein pVco5_005 [Vibrio phage pVco-5]
MTLIKPFRKLNPNNSKTRSLRYVEMTNAYLIIQDKKSMAFRYETNQITNSM